MLLFCSFFDGFVLRVLYPAKLSRCFLDNCDIFLSAFSALVSALCCKGGYSGTLIVLEEEDNGMERKGSMEALHG